MQIIRDTLQRYRLWYLLIILFVLISTVTRIILFIYELPEVSLQPVVIGSTFLAGFFFDILAAWYFSFFLFLVIWLLPQKFLLSKAGSYFQKSFFLIHLLLLVLNAVSEIFFWNEFSVRYNFIAVDYLIYTNEVLNNIRQSYPIGLVISGLLIITFAIWLLVRKQVFTGQQRISLLNRMITLVTVLSVSLSIFYFIEDDIHNISSNKVNNELAANGIYQFGNAFRKNEMPYLDFYAKDDEAAVFHKLHELLQEPAASFESKDEHSITRKINPGGEPHNWNVVMITIESLSAEYLSYFKEYHNYYYPDYLLKQIGITPKLTPNLDSLIDESLFFTQLYASGTRTVRGLEAVSTSMPPTPGQSIVKRLPTRNNMFTLGEVLQKHGYDTKFIYGGNSFFDNMGDFFGKNGYQVVDERDIPADSIHHETAWGVCDEDLYVKALSEMDKSYGAGKLFFNHLMTVSNHRPYTYPEGKVVIPPSIKRREGGLIYTDYAIGQFLQQARKKPWFNNTIFVILADHCASVGGKTDMPVNKYHIPGWIYAPGLVKPGKFERLTSQIDIPPTIMGLLNIPYESDFFGYDVFHLEKGRERLLLVNYQDIAYVKDGKMVVLSPRRKARMFKPDFRTGIMRPDKMDKVMEHEAIAWFQGAASYIDQHRHNRN
ncbi:sulfatase-like hydrolase/transferase [Flavihumibacter sediminis]|nr:sulfatase-like hydrolase/transferase [Flavihumibacter sediminis]